MRSGSSPIRRLVQANAPAARDECSRAPEFARQRCRFQSGDLARRGLVLLLCEVDLFAQDGATLRRRNPQLHLRWASFEHFDLDAVADQNRFARPPITSTRPPTADADANSGNRRESPASPGGSADRSRSALTIRVPDAGVILHRSDIPGGNLWHRVTRESTSHATRS